MFCSFSFGYKTLGYVVDEILCSYHVRSSSTASRISVDKEYKEFSYKEEEIFHLDIDFKEGRYRF